jgi:hypothetical protein
MKRSILFLLLINNVVLYSQDSLFNMSIEYENKLIPLVFKDKKSMFLKHKVVIENNNLVLVDRRQWLKSIHNLKFNFYLPKISSSISIGASYAHVLLKGKFIRFDDTTAYSLASNLYSNYYGVNLRYLKVKRINSDFNIQHGIELGAGALKAEKNNVQFIKKENEIYGYSPKYYRKFEINEPFDYELNISSKVYDLNLSYNLVFEYNINSKFSLLAGLEVPIIRFFFYDYYSFIPGISLNTESFFTSYTSFSLGIRDTSSFNKNFSYSLKKHHATSFNFSIRYYL